MDWMARMYVVFAFLSAIGLIMAMWWVAKNRYNKEGKRFVNQDIRWCQDVVKISENALHWVSRINRPLTDKERADLLDLGYEYHRMSMVPEMVIKRNGEIHNERKETKEA